MTRRPAVCALVLLAALACKDRKDERAAAPAKTTVANDSGQLDAARSSPAVRLAAFDSDGLRIAAVEDDMLRTTTHSDIFVDSIAWLDEHTLVTSGSTPGGVVVSRYIDDEPPRTLTLDDVLFETKHGSVTSLVIAGDAVWVARCIDAEQDPCKAEAFVRAWPEPHVRVTKLPAGADRARAAGNDDVDRGAPTAPAPSDASVKIVRYVDKHDLGDRPIAGVDCVKGDERSRFPDASSIEGDAWTARSVRWVSTEPPIYEVVALEKLAGRSTELTHYLRACDPKPFDGFAALGAARWAELRHRDGEAEGTWTVRVGDRTIGTLAGGDALRANR